MFRIGKVKDALTGAKGSEIISRVIVIFALVYHIAALVVFYNIGVHQMFYFNCGSVLLFFILAVAIYTDFVKDISLSFYISYIEVVAHQLLADYYLGINTKFHYFILMMGFIVFLIIKNKPRISLIFGIFSAVTFISLEVCVDLFTPVYDINPSILAWITHANITLGVLVILALVIIFAFKSYGSEHRLEQEISKKSREVYFQNNKITQLQNHIINSLASLVENRDSDTGEHIQRTSAYVEIIARKAFEKHVYPDFINEQFISLIKRAAPMHDIGKIVVPDGILKKPGRLTPEEFEKMKLHTTEGSLIIQQIVGVSEDKKYVQIAIDVSKGHHERWDGKGYPNNLKENEIPVAARIMAIADVFDALVSPRCYKDPIPVEEAFRILREESGSHFDPILVEVFLSERDQIQEVLRKYVK